MSVPQQVNQQLRPVAQSVAPKRMALAGITRGKQEVPHRITLYAPEGTGKTTFASEAPSPIFLGAEDGTAHLDVARFPRPESFADVLEAIRTLTTDQHEFQTLAIDTIDWIEPLIWKQLCQADGVSNIEEVGGGYKKGYESAVDEWRKLLDALERLQSTKRMHVIILAHTAIKTFKNPEGEDFDRYQIKLHEKASALIREWCETLLFARQETLAGKNSKRARVKGVGVGARIIHTERSAAFDAKNRHSLPPELPLSWAEFEAAAKVGQVAPVTALREEISRKAKQLGADLEKTILETVAKAGEDAGQLARINNRVNARLSALEDANTTAETAGKGS